MKRKEILIATLGVSPQVVTISLDLLAEQGYSVNEVVTIYTDDEKVKAALTQLDDELQRLSRLPHRPVVISDQTGPVRDFWTKAEVTALLQTLYREVKSCKQAGQRVHLLIAGGRKVMSAYALVVAQLLFDPADRVWHLFSKWQPGDEIQMHVGPDSQAALVPVPVIPVMPTSKAAADLALGDDPWQLIEHHRTLQQQERDREIRNFLRKLPQAQQEVARLLAEGLDNKTIANRRSRSIGTVVKQVSLIYEEWRSFFGLPFKASVRDQIVAELSSYFARKGGE